MGDNFSEYPEASPNNEDLLATQDLPTLQKEKITLSRLRTFLFQLVETITFSLVTGITEFAQGVMGWDATNHTFTFGLEHGVQLQLGMEIVRYTHNVTGEVIPDGTFVFLAPVTPDGHQSIGLVDSSISARHAGLTTSEFADEGHGYIVKDGVAHDIPIAGLTLNMPVYADPLVLGGLTNTLPTWADYIIFVGAVIKDNGDGTGDIDVSPYIVQREVPTPVILGSYSPTPDRDAEENIHGGLIPIVTGHDLLAAPLTLTGITAQGLGKLLIVVNSATPDCDITVNGTQVDRDTGIETPNQDSILTVDATTVDTSGVDTNGYVFNDFQHAYITDKWFDGQPEIPEDVVISGAGATVPTDIDVYQISFEQFNDAKYIELATADMNYFVLSPAAISANIYTVEVSNDVVNLTRQGSHIRAAAQHTANRMYRPRRGNLGIVLDGTTDGLFITVQMGGINKFSDAGIKIWGNVLY